MKKGITTMGMAELGRYMQRRRGILGITQSELADFTDIPQTTISRYELGRFDNVPKPEVMKTLANGLDCTVDDLLIAYGYELTYQPTEDGAEVEREPTIYTMIEQAQKMNMSQAGIDFIRDTLVFIQGQEERQGNS